GPVALELLVQLLGDRGRDQVLLRGEMGVEGTVGQARVRHQCGHAGAVDAIALQASTGGLDDPSPRRLLVLLAVSGHTHPHTSRMTRCLRSSGDYSTVIIQ